MHNDLDALDKKLIHVLQTNDVFTPDIRKIAALLGAAPSTVHFRINRLFKEGVLSAPHSSVRGEKVGRSLTMICLVKVKSGKGSERSTFHEEIPGKLAKIPAVQEVHVLQGSWDVLVKMRVADNKEYTEILRNDILSLDGVQDVVGLTAIETTKETDEIVVE